MSVEPYRHDVFVSYRHQDPDKTWVRKTFVPALEASGLKVCIDYRDFRLGELLLKEMARAVEQSRWTVAVLTPAYLHGTFTDLENVWADHLGQSARTLRLLYVVREPCDPGTIRIKARLRLDLTTDEEVEAGLPRLIASLRPPVDETTGATG